jgi:serine/threonine protein kinase
LNALNIYEKRVEKSTGVRPTEIKERHKKRIFQAILTIRKLVRPDVTIDSIFHFLESVKIFKENLSYISTLKMVPFPLQLSDKTNKVVWIEFGRNGKAYINFNEGVLDQGGFKQFERVYQYRDFDTAAKLSPLINLPAAKRGFFSKEVEFLEEISDLPTSEKQGLVQVYSTDSDRIYEKMYDTDLTSYINRNLNKPSRYPFTIDQKMSIVAQMNRALETLHQHGIAHNDIKLDNIFLKFSEPNFRGQIEAALADFGLSTRPYELLISKQPRPPYGSLFYVAPEVFGERWEGDTLKAQVQNGLKSDVFSYALTVLRMFYPGQFSWEEKCVNMTGRVYSACKMREIKNTLETHAEEKRVTRFSYWALAGLEPSSENRVTSKQLAKAFDYVQKFPLAVDRDYCVEDYRVVEEKWHALAHFRTMSQNTDKKVSDQPESWVGRYALVTHAYKKQYCLAVIFTDRQQKIRTKILNSDPSQISAVAEELQFLKDLGYLTDPIK